MNQVKSLTKLRTYSSRFHKAEEQTNATIEVCKPKNFLRKRKKSLKNEKFFLNAEKLPPQLGVFVCIVCMINQA
jgi:hypothetical protein